MVFVNKQYNLFFRLCTKTDILSWLGFTQGVGRVVFYPKPILFFQYFYFYY
jgi:hypothetical protein